MASAGGFGRFSRGKPQNSDSAKAQRPDNDPAPVLGAEFPTDMNIDDPSTPWISFDETIDIGDFEKSIETSFDDFEFGSHVPPMEGTDLSSSTQQGPPSTTRVNPREGNGLGIFKGMAGFRQNKCKDAKASGDTSSQSDVAESRQSGPEFSSGFSNDTKSPGLSECTQSESENRISINIETENETQRHNQSTSKEVTTSIAVDTHKNKQNSPLRDISTVQNLQNEPNHDHSSMTPPVTLNADNIPTRVIPPPASRPTRQSVSFALQTPSPSEQQVGGSCRIGANYSEPGTPAPTKGATIPTVTPGLDQQSPLAARVTPNHPQPLVKSTDHSPLSQNDKDGLLSGFQANQARSETRKDSNFHENKSDNDTANSAPNHLGFEDLYANFLNDLRDLEDMQDHNNSRLLEMEGNFATAFSSALHDQAKFLDIISQLEKAVAASDEIIRKFREL